MSFAARSNWTQQMQHRYADPVYQAYWRPDGDVTPVDAESGTSDAATGEWWFEAYDCATRAVERLKWKVTGVPQERIEEIGE